MNARVSTEPEMLRLAVGVRGIVQGVGFRPFVYNAARAAGLTGWVLNQSDLVWIEVQGPTDRVTAFVAALRNQAPPQARVDSVETRSLEVLPGPQRPFEIRESQPGSRPRPATPADLGTCPDCLAEIRTPGERRYRYPFTNCTNCGPRWSIISGLPYDRPRTSMARFEMCSDCRAEYENPSDRRFHAQPIACPHCGPHLSLLNPSGEQLAADDEALRRAATAIVAGQVLAIKGLGGFQLLVDAGNGSAVALLRTRKRRPDKPLAVMTPDLATAERLCHVSAEESAVLCSHQAPIVLLRRRAAAGVADAVAPGNPYLGVMLPYTPLHHLLLAAVDRPVVCTSGNLAEEPMAITLDDALDRLAPIADLFLTHDRPIVRPVDDSVARLGPSGLELFRRARGFAPLPIGIGAGPVRRESGGLESESAPFLCLALGGTLEEYGRVGDPAAGGAQSARGRSG